VAYFESQRGEEWVAESCHVHVFAVANGEYGLVPCPVDLPKDFDVPLFVVGDNRSVGLEITGENGARASGEPRFIDNPVWSPGEK
jgi:hypothetical protein